MSHEFRTYALYGGDASLGLRSQSMQECSGCGMKVDLWEDGTRSRWAEMVLEAYPNCELLEVASVMES